MASPRLATLVIIIILSLSSPLLYITTSISDTVIYGGCSKLKYNPDSPYESNLNSLLTSLINSASTSSYNKNTVTGSNPQDIIYGHYQCRGDLAMHDCATCVTHSVSQLGTLCQQTSGGVAQLEGCYVKYDNITFIGVEDKSVVMKKCDPLINNNNNNGGNSMDGRDEVLGSLGGASGAYRVSGSGDTQGMAQCVEDLSVGECQDCLMEAIGRLKSECDGAVSGEMFLAKCYVKYSTTTTSRDHADKSDDHGNSNDDSDDGEKTFALIIGVLAGIVLLVVFITFLGRVFGGNDEEFRGRRLDKCPHEDKV